MHKVDELVSKHDLLRELFRAEQERDLAIDELQREQKRVAQNSQAFLQLRRRLELKQFHLWLTWALIASSVVAYLFTHFD